MEKFRFGDKVRRIGGRDVFVVLGTEKTGNIQIATFNWKTSDKPERLERA